MARRPSGFYSQAGRPVSLGPSTVPKINPWAQPMVMQAVWEDQQRHKIVASNDFNLASGTTEYCSSTVDLCSDV